MSTITAQRNCQLVMQQHTLLWSISRCLTAACWAIWNCLLLNDVMWWFWGIAPVTSPHTLAATFCCCELGSCTKLLEAAGIRVDCGRGCRNVFTPGWKGLQTRLVVPSEEFFVNECAKWLSAATKIWPIWIHFLLLHALHVQYIQSKHHSQLCSDWIYFFYFQCIRK